MSAANVLREIFQAPLLPDPGASQSIYLNDMSPVHCDLVSATAESRTLPVATRAGAIISIGMKTDGGDITLTVTGGYNEDGDTTFTFSDPGQFVVFESFDVSGTITWRKIADYQTAGGAGVIAAAATPASVATSPGAAQRAALTETGGVGGDTSIATTGVGGVGGGEAITLGAGGTATAAATAATGGAGGASVLATGAGGAEAIATVTSTGGAGGALTQTTGVGGAVSGAVSGVATGGASGAVALRSGIGGAVTATTGTNVGGASGTASFGSGVGGAASGATDTGGASGALTITSGIGGAGDTGGASGVLTVSSGTGGAGSGTGGASGNVVIGTGAAGSGGSPVVGFIGFNPGAAEKWRIDSVGNLNSVAGTPANVTADGAITATGGIAFTDVLNAWIDDATHGSGTVAHLIGNQTITTVSDIRIKKNIQPFNMSCAAVKRAPRTVTYEYDHPSWGGDRAAPGDEDARKWGPNARGTYVGFIAQETIEWAPWAINAGAGKDCPKCRAGIKCDDETHPIWHVEYQHLVPMLTAALKEMILRVEKLEARLAG